MKMAVVGCEASGKTVFMSALVDYYGREAASSPTRLKLTPENEAANKFERLQFRQMRCQHRWPSATPPNRTVEIKWTLRQNGEALAAIDLIEFGGETFRAAFRNRAAEPREGSVEELLKYLGDTDFFVVLVSIKALLAPVESGASDEDLDREAEALWVTRGILDFIRKNRPEAGVVIALTQADRYRNELGEAGDPRAFFAAHWPTVASAFGDIPVVAVASVSKTDAAGNPAEDYHAHGILPVMRLFSRRFFGSEDALESGELKRVRKPRSGRHLSGAVVFVFVVLLVALGAELAWFLVRRPAERVVEVAVTNTVEKIVTTEVPVTNTVEVEKVVRVEKRVEVPVTNTVEKLVTVPITNTVEKVVKIPVTNMVEKVVKIPVTNTVEKVLQVHVTNTVEKVVEVAKVFTNVVERIIERQLPPDYRVWTDHNGRKVVAKWTETAPDESAITLLLRNNRKIEAVIWKFSPEDQAYIKKELQRRKNQR